MKIYNIAQIGTFDVKNFGDLLFPIVLKDELRKLIKIENIILFSPNGGDKPFEVNTKVYKIDELEDMHLKYHFDAIIIGGGDLIRLDKNIASDYSENYKAAIKIWQIPIFLGKKYNIPVIFNAIGVPFDFSYSQQEFVKLFCQNVNYIAVRDYNSKQKLEDCGVKNIKVIPDSIMLISDIYSKNGLSITQNKFFDKLNVLNLKKYIVFQHNATFLNDDNYTDNIIKFINHVITKYNYDILLVPIGYVHNDIKFLEKIYNNNNSKIHIIREELNPEEMLSIFANSCGFVGTSLHGILTSSVYNVPILAINTSNLTKVSGYLTNINKNQLEVKKIDKLIEVFDKNFFTQTFEKIETAKETVKTHFEFIANLISRKNELKSDDNFIVDLLDKIYSKNEVLKDIKSANFVTYFDYGTGFNEIDREKIINVKDKIIIKIKKDVLNLRIDPFEEIAKAIKINKLTNCNEKDIIYNNFYPLNGYLISSNNDPQIIINRSFKKGEVIEFEFEIISDITDQIVGELNAKNDKIIMFENSINKKMDEVMIENKQLLKEIKKIYQSKSWKFTKPLRFISFIIGKNRHTE